MAAPTLTLTLAAAVGILLSGGFVWWEVGRFATPQVPVTRFDERKELFAYTAGLFVGVPLAIAYLLFVISLANDALVGALVFLALLIAGTEAAQWALARTRYWGSDRSVPFYAVGFRAAIGGIVTLAVLAQYLGVGPISADALALALFESVTIVALEVAGAMLSLRPGPATTRRSGGPLSGALVGAVGFFLLGLGSVAGEVAAFAGTAVAFLGAILVYRRLRPLLEEVPPPSAGPKPPPGEAPSPFGRTDRSSTGPNGGRRRSG